ncbi:uncharacterized protein EI90DRAFT_779319 [Cantharellus anzutake]|uniref:uncharacterized protein n=1 Tax=Cantharellus anzutake TaxID=1750568 RepID=UPI00190511CE|nr:uncharacterized protein EI90DRAFT_779319 [Cantharellus anzutake]KAF8342731.1 hypothetical protein EI90DRAFT_779319 [Cantharellus anzutake]
MTIAPDRLPPAVSEFFSAAIYDDSLAFSAGKEKYSSRPIRFVDVSKGTQVGTGHSFLNKAEVDTALQCAISFTRESLPFKIVTPFEAQRLAIQRGLEAAGLAWKDVCYTVKTIQGLDAPYIILSVVQTYSPGFLNDFGSTVTALTRFSKGMLVIANRFFLTEDSVAKSSLLADMAKVFRQGGWIDPSVLTGPAFSAGSLFDGDDLESEITDPDSESSVIEPTVWGEEPTNTGQDDFGWDDSPGATWG